MPFPNRPLTTIVRAIIGAAAALLLLAGCSSLVRLAYGQGPQLIYWRLDGYLDLDGEQSLRAREAIDQWYDWHRRTQLADYAAVLARAQRDVMQPTTPQAACAWRDELQRRIDAAVDRATPPLARLVATLRPEQLQQLEQRLAKDLAEMRDEYAQPDRKVRSRAQAKRVLERVESFYGRLDDAQRARLNQLLAASPFDAERWTAERERRNADILRALAPAAAAGDAARAEAALRLLTEQTLHSPRPDYRAYQAQLRREQCVISAALHNAMTPAQRQHARNKLKAWEDDARLLAADTSARATTPATEPPVSR